jgi:hypothetical protein
MAKIVGGGGPAGSKSVGRTGFGTKLSKTGLITRGNKILSVTPKSVRRLFARNPANRTAIIGTDKDVLGDANQKWNRVIGQKRNANSVEPSGTRIRKAAPGTADQTRRVKRGVSSNYQNKNLKKF